MDGAGLFYLFVLLLGFYSVFLVRTSCAHTHAHTPMRCTALHCTALHCGVPVFLPPPRPPLSRRAAWCGRAEAGTAASGAVQWLCIVRHACLSLLFVDVQVSYKVAVTRDEKERELERNLASGGGLGGAVGSATTL